MSEFKLQASGSPPTPDVSIITPTYNRAALLPAALESVAAQTALKLGYRVEVIVADDGSTDNTPIIIQPFLECCHDPRGPLTIRYFRLDKQGVVTARNKAIAQSTGQYIAFLDSDDYWAPGKLEAQLKILEENPGAGVGVVHTSFRYVNEAGEFQDDGPQRLDNPCVGDCLNVLLDEFLVIFSSVMIRRSIVDQAAGLEPHGQPFDNKYTNAQDYDLILRAARLCKFGYVPEPLTLYRLHGAHGAMGNLKRAYGFHSQVQIDFAKRYGAAIGFDETEARRRAAKFVFGRAESAFWKRQFTVVEELCDLAREMGFSDARFDALARKAHGPKWVYKVKDAVDGVRGKGLGKKKTPKSK